jgi:hypothetical protein
MPETVYVPDPREEPRVYTANRNYGNSSPQQVYDGLVAPTPDDPTLPAVFYPSGGGPMQQWDVDTQAWV